MASLYDLGEGVWIRSAFTNPTTGAPLDPSTVRLRLLPPSATTPTVYVYQTDPEIVKDSTGVFASLVTADEVGYWQYRWEGENVAPAVQEGSFYVRRSSL